MISDRSLTSLRCAAAVACALPAVRLRIEGNGATLLDVARPPLPVSDEHPVMPACAFRRAVACAHRHRKAGERLRFMGLDRDCDPAVSYGVRPTIDAALTGGLLRIRHDDRWLHALSVASDRLVVVDAVAEPISAGDHMVDLAIHFDEDLEVSILHVSTDVGDHVRSVAALDALTTVAARLSVSELEAFLLPEFTGMAELHRH